MLEFMVSTAYYDGDAVYQRDFYWTAPLLLSVCKFLDIIWVVMIVWIDSEW